MTLPSLSSVKNTSAADAVTIDTVVDSIYGDLAAKGTCGTLIGKVLQPDNHAAGGPDEATCTFIGPVTGSAGSTHTERRHGHGPRRRRAAADGA